MGVCRKAAVLFLFTLLLPTLALCLESGSDKSDGQVTEAGIPVAKKSGNKVNKNKKLSMKNPEKLREIVEKSILEIQSAELGEDVNNLDLPVKGRVTSTVGIRPDPINGDIRMHNGIDIAIAEGSPVMPVASGRVAYSGMQPGYGNMVIIQHEDGMISIYAHHQRNTVKTGERVKKETMLAYSGSTGHSTGPHLHFEAWQGGVNVTSAFLPSFSGRKIEASSHASLAKTNLRKVIMSDGTILFVEVVTRNKKKTGS